MIQVDTLCHRIPGFIEKAGRAGVRRVFIGLESINAKNLALVKKGQNRLDEYRGMLSALYAGDHLAAANMGMLSHGVYSW